jgi:hypothetical protein
MRPTDIPRFASRTSSEARDAAGFDVGPITISSILAWIVIFLIQPAADPFSKRFRLRPNPADRRHLCSNQFIARLGSSRDLPARQSCDAEWAKPLRMDSGQSDESLLDSRHRTLRAEDNGDILVRSRMAKLNRGTSRERSDRRITDRNGRI